MVERPNLSSRIKNSSYIFVPFFYNESFALSCVEQFWKYKQQSNKYFLKYISDKFTLDCNACYCKNFIMTDNARKEWNIISAEEKCYTETQKYSKYDSSFSFYIDEIQMFLFETNIGFIVYKIEHEKQEDAYDIATKNYHLKKIYNTKLFYKIKEEKTDSIICENSEIHSLSKLSEYILKKTFNKGVNIFFNYSRQEEQRSNILTYFNLNLDHDLGGNDIENIKKMLFYLKRNYHYQWKITSSEKENEEYYQASPYIHWGITSEATACITITDPQTYFVSNSFYDNFHSYYLYTYILALHQKYTLYYFLSKFNADVGVDKLENCLSELADFRAKYVFQIISESETYQTVYSKTISAFALEKLFADIDEQVKTVIEIKERKNNNNIIIREKKINLILGILAFLGLFSAINDINTLLDCLKCFFSDNTILITKMCADVALVCIGVFLFVRFFIANHKNYLSKNHKKRGK